MISSSSFSFSEAAEPESCGGVILSFEGDRPLISRSLAVGENVPGKYVGIERPDVRKKRSGDAKTSNALAGDENKVVLRERRVDRSHPSCPVIREFVPAPVP
jgi:hypothetical protein